MALSVNTNIASDGIISQLDRTQQSFNTEVQRLSSGLRINSAGDDPAGLVIGTQFQAQVSGLNQAVSNAQDSIGVTQTADGALSEVSSLLTQMRNLALQAANTGPSDTASIAADQQQITASIQTINNIANTTQFGTRKLLNGDSGVTGTTDNSTVTFVNGATTTVAGTYQVNVTQAATQGFITGNLSTAQAAGTPVNVQVASSTIGEQIVGAGGNGSGNTTATETLTFTGLTGGNVTVQIGLACSTANITSDINNCTSLSSLGISATTVGGNVTITSTGTTPSFGTVVSSADLTTSAGLSNTTSSELATTQTNTLTFTGLGSGGSTSVNLSIASGSNATAVAADINACTTLTAQGVSASDSGGTLTIRANSSISPGFVVSANSTDLGNATGISTSATAASEVTTSANSTLTISGTLVGGTASSNVTLSIAAGSNATVIAADINANTTLVAAGIQADVVNGSLTVFGPNKLSSFGATELNVTANDADLAAASGFSTGGTASKAGGTDTSTALGTGETLTFTNGAGIDIAVALQAGTTIQAAVNQMNDSLTSAGIGMTAAYDSTTSQLTFTNTSFGSAPNVLNTVMSSVAGNSSNLDLLSDANTNVNIASGSGALDGTAGLDVAGSFTEGSVTTQATGAGQFLTGIAGFPANGLEVQVTGNSSIDNTNLGSVTVINNSMTFQIGAFANQTVDLSLGNLVASNLGNTAAGTTTLSGANVSVANIDVTTQNGAGAQDALLILDAAIQQVSTVRANLGAFQSDILQSSVTDLQTEQQNMSSAESNIMDANLAQESVTFSKDQILQQTGMAMLAQANQNPQLLLKLIQ